MPANNLGTVHGVVRSTREADFEAFDSLPPRLRELVREFPFNLSSCQVLGFYQRLRMAGWAPEAIESEVQTVFQRTLNREQRIR